MRGFGPDVVSVVWPARVQLFGFLLFKYSVVYTVESLSLFISFIYLNLYLIGDNISIS